MKPLGRLLREERQRAGLTQDALAQAAGCSKSHLSLMESGDRTISAEWARKFERVLGIRDDRLTAAVRWQQTPREERVRIRNSQALADDLRQAMKRKASAEELRRLIHQRVSNIDEPQMLEGRIPVINQVAAGYPREFTDLDYPAAVADDYVSCPDVADPDAFAARVVGDSMEPAYREGEIVVFSPVVDTPDGCDCFIRLERDNETTFKRIYFERDGSHIRLQPLNNKYPPRTVAREDIAGMYRAVYVLRRLV